MIDSLAPGGAETSLVAMTPYIVREGVQLYVLPLGHRLDLKQCLQDAGAVVLEPQFGRGRINHIRSVMKAARRYKPDLIHTTLYEADIAGRAAAKLCRIPCSTSMVNDSYSDSHYEEAARHKVRLAQLVDYLTSRGDVGFHAITAAIADSVAPRLRIPREEIAIIPRGREIHDLSEEERLEMRNETRDALGIETTAPVVLTAGRLEPQKGLIDLIDASEAVSEAYSDVVFLIAGKDGRASESLQEAAANASANIRFLGHRDDVERLMASADVFCFPSHREGFGGVLLEAMSNRCAIVASRIPTTVEVLTGSSGDLGLLVDVCSPEALAAGITGLLSNPGQCKALGERARAHVVDKYKLEMIGRQMVEFFSAATV